MTLGNLSIQDPNNVSVSYLINGNTHESAFGDLSQFIKSYRKIFTLNFDGITNSIINQIRNEINNGAISLVLNFLNINTQALVQLSEENVPYQGDEYRRSFSLVCDDQTAYYIGNEVSTEYSSGIRINEVWHPEPQTIRVYKEVQNVDYDCQDGISTRDGMFERLRININWNNINNLDIKNIVKNVFSKEYSNVSHPLFDDTGIIEISKEEYINSGIGNLNLIISSIEATI